MIRKIKNTIGLYMIVFLPLIFSVGRFIPLVETAVTFLSIVVLILEQALKRKHFLKYVVIVCLFGASSFMYPQLNSHDAHIKCLIIMFLSMDAVEAELYEQFRKIIKQYSLFISAQLMAILFANIVFLFINSGYSEKYGDLWGVHAYRGIFADPHQCAYHLCALLVVLLIVSQYSYQKYHYFILAGFECCTIITGARVPTILALFIGLIYFADHMPSFLQAKEMKGVILRGAVILMGAAVVSFFLMRYTTFGIKMLESIAVGNIDSGRATLRSRDLALFSNADWLHKLFGHGTDGVINYHGSFAYATYIWSHNDFMQMLCGMGVVMFSIYCWGWIKLFWEALHVSKACILAVMTLIFTAFFNGLYIHSRFVFVMPLLLYYMKERSTEEAEVLYE